MSEIKFSLEELGEKVPPVLVRMMAVVCGKGRQPRLKTIDAIVNDSGLSKRMVQRMVWSTVWDFKYNDVSRYLVGCGVDILSKTQLYQFIRQWADQGFPQITDPKMRERFYRLMKWTK